MLKREAPLPELQNERIFPGGIQVKALFEPECKWRLIEEFGAASFTVQADGRLCFQADYTHKENLMTWLLTFQDLVELLEPMELRREMHRALLRTLEKYKEKEE